MGLAVCDLASLRAETGCDLPASQAGFCDGLAIFRGTAASFRSWFIAIGNQQHGPYSEDQFREMVARGAIKPGYVHLGGWNVDWHARDVPGLLSPDVAAPFEPVDARSGCR